MSRKFKIVIVGLLTLSLLAIMASSTALAQDETPDEAEPKAPGWHGRGHGLGRGMMGGVQLEAIAEVLGMTADELSTQLWGGKTLADLAEQAGVELEDLRAAAEAAQEAATREAIEQAVEDGELTREHADWLLEGLDNGYIGGRGCGGLGNKGFGGRGGLGGSRFGGFPGEFQGGGFGRFQRPAFSTSDSDL
jgi:hypothetical protein